VQGGVKHGSDGFPVVIFRTLGVSNAKMAVLPAFAFSIQPEIGGRGAALPAPEPIPYSPFTLHHPPQSDLSP